MKKQKRRLFCQLFSSKKLFSEVIPLIVLFLSFASCDIIDNDDKNPPCPPMRIGASSPYSEPVWHPSGEFIGFNYTPLERIEYPYGEHCQGEYFWNDDSSGFWLINSDGTNMRRILSFKLYSPVWSPDGEWIAFEYNAQIYKMPFNISTFTFDTASIVQLTTEGRNFYPTWSPDGQWIAYNRSICNGPQTCGIWLMTNESYNNHFIVSYGNYPDWGSLDSFLFLTRAINSSGEVMGDTLWKFDIKTNKKQPVVHLKGSNRNIKYLRNKNLIVYWSDGNLWIMDSSGTNKSQLTFELVDVDFGLPFSCSIDDNKIVYTKYSPYNWTYENGTLWMLDLITGEKRQLTFSQI